MVFASQVNSQSNGFVNIYPSLFYVGLEAIAVILLAGSHGESLICQSLLRALMGQRVNVLILEKALTLDLRQFEDSEFYDKLTNARREASVRPLSLVNRTFGLVQNALSLFHLRYFASKFLRLGGGGADFGSYACIYFRNKVCWRRLSLCLVGGRQKLVNSTT